MHKRLNVQEYCENIEKLVTYINYNNEINALSNVDNTNVSYFLAYNPHICTYVDIYVCMYNLCIYTYVQGCEFSDNRTSQQNATYN